VNFKRNIVAAIFAIAVLSSNLISKEDNSETVIAKVGKEEITYKQLEKAFQKNMNRKNDLLKNVSKDSVLNFVELYTNYRLKVQDALDRGYDKDSVVMADIKNNRKTLAENYFFDMNVMQPNIDNYLAQRKRAVKFAYMLFTYNPLMAQEHFNSKMAMPNDSAWIVANDVLKKLKKGEDFSELAKKYSNDKETAEKGGIVNNFVTIGKLQREIDNALFTLKPGEYFPEVIKTSYGYFLMKMIEEEPRVLVLASHILLSNEKDDKLQTKKTIDSVYARLKAGDKFVTLAEKISDESSSAINGGRMTEYYGRTSGFEKSGSQLVDEFVNPLMKLKNGEMTGVVETPYGYHIIRRDSSKYYNQELEQEDIKKFYRRLYFEDDKKKFMEKISTKYGFAIEENVFTEFKSKFEVNKTNLDTAWAKNIESDLKRKVLFKYGKMSNTVGDFIEINKTNPKFRGTANTDEGFRKTIKALIEPLVIDDATRNLEKQNLDFGSLVKEFQDGMLLFKVESVEVWEKLKFDSTKAKVYWDSTSSRYKTNIMYDISEIFVISDSLVNNLKLQLDGGANFDDLAANNTVRTGLREKKGNHGELDSKRNKFSNILPTEIKAGMLVGPKKLENGFAILKINKVLPIRIKTFPEAITDFAPAFQDQQQKLLLKNWLERVKTKHNVQIDKELIVKLLDQKK